MSGGLVPLGAMAGSLFALMPLAKLGARRTIFLFGSPALIFSWIIIGCANSVHMIFVGRFLGGVGTGIVIACAPLYVLEVASVSIRGRLGILPQFLMILGILTSYIFGSFLNWRYLSLACGLISLPSVILLIFTPDSPNWLVSKSCDDKALRVLQNLHGTNNAALLLQDLQDKFVQRLSQSNKIGGARKSMINSGMIKASAVALGIISFQQLTGINGVTFYAVTIFRESSGNGEMDAHFPSIILASTQLIASFISTLLVERYGRKILLTISSILITIAGGCLGSFFYFFSTSSPEYLCWIPLALLILFAFGFAIGFGPVAWILIAEILPQETRHIMNPLIIAYNWFCVFLVTKSFPLLLLEIKIYGIFWLYATIAFLGLLFVTIFVPETKGKTSEQIKNCFEKQSSVINNNNDHFNELKVILSNGNN
ncbi:Facilitated trehalose transporter Tret1 [Folsomia candida]|uniref:Facilitated trehalose transporter Tret1 n=1 Tax=Folsomia candida TaxID=158441 RepID=A0A226DA63_FOLCA|nr:Facilitated trehalose transporter Tret1 [Folsomia candida]